MPSKVYEIMASGRPVLASADVHSDLWNLVSSTRSGICLDPHDPKQLASALMTLYEDPPLCQRMGERGRQEVEHRYSRQAVLSQYDELIRAVAAKKRARQPIVTTALKGADAHSRAAPPPLARSRG
jgi:colanic acid biosynthesis glycosyl transferase WcaI